MYQINPVPSPVAAPQLQGLQNHVVVHHHVPFVTPPTVDTANIPASRLKSTLRDTGRVVGWVTIPAWAPLWFWHRDLKRLPNLWKIPKAQVGGWHQKFVADLNQYEKWTPEEQTRILKQQAGWFAMFVASVVAALIARHYLPMMAYTLAWWGKAHDVKTPSKWETGVFGLLGIKNVDLIRWVPSSLKGKYFPHVNVVSWVLGHGQAPEPGPTIIDGLRQRLRDGSNEPL